MSSVSRGRIVSAIITTAVLIGLVTGLILFISQPHSQQASRTSARGLSSVTTPTMDNVTTQLTPGSTVTVGATPTQDSSSSSTPTTSRPGGTNGATPTATATSPTGTPPSPTPPLPSPTATPTTPYDNAQLIAQSPTALTGTTNGWITVTAILLNTGTTTWDNAKGYRFRCFQYCGLGWNSPNTGFVVSPGASRTFTGTIDVYPWASYYTVQSSVWRLVNTATDAFGQGATVTVVQHGWDRSGAFMESSPSCRSDGSSWSFHSSSGTANCGSSGLALSQGGPGGGAMALNSTPAGYSYTNYLVKVHIHFTTTSSTTFAGIVLSIPSSASGGHQTEFMVSPAGYYCETQTLSYCVPGGSAFKLPASSDYDLNLNVGGSTYYVSINGTSYGDGGFIAGGPTGLIEMTASGSTDTAYFTDYQLYQYK